MADFHPGQRWVSETESDLGLGMVAAIEGRTVVIEYPACGESRSYAMDNAPLSRAQYRVGEHVRDNQGRLLLIEQVEEQGHILFYLVSEGDADPSILAEIDLDSSLVYSRPQDRLLSGRLHKNKWFSLRYQTLKHRERLAMSAVNGLSGARAEPLPHQLYIAHEVSQRPFPRVLLADEVGLGKTIEACMILHRQLIIGRASRVLIVVPESLLHQWLVELLRRFNLHFSLFDEHRWDAESEDTDNPFLSEQLVLCSVDFLVSDAKRYSKVLEAGWDMLIVDEAHHLEWTEEEPSIEYLLVQQLSRLVPGLLLLTATPEQYGRGAHFARLKLLDQDRFHDREQFETEVADYAIVADIVEILQRGDELSNEHKDNIQMYWEDDELLSLLDGEMDSEQQRTHLIDTLLDRHGTGRVLFRNTRNRIEGFPSRELYDHPLVSPEPYHSLEQTLPAEAMLTPEYYYEEEHPSAAERWWQFDPRIDWLIEHIRQDSTEKRILICAHAETAMGIAEALRVREGIDVAVFHEHMSIIDRDRAAAYFADPEDGTSLLCCSEIGSEGRNFQFAHELILFDLPLNPDLLEQRIGRLDRIGQTQDIRIHVPYLDFGAQKVLFNWYKHGLQAFVRICPEAHEVFSLIGGELLQEMSMESSSEMDELLQQTQVIASAARERLQQGRDQLLELASCRQPAANNLVELIKANEKPLGLMHYLEQLVDCYNLNMETHSDHSVILKPSNHMVVDSFPALPEDGTTVTTDRAIALANEDRMFLSWEHPMIGGAMDMVLSGAQGRTALLHVKNSGQKTGVMLECLYVLETVGENRLHADRFMPPTVIRLLVDMHGNDQGELLDFDFIDNNGEQLDRVRAVNVIEKMHPLVVTMIEKSEALAEQKAAPVIRSAQQQVEQYYQQEIARLDALKHVNPSVRPEEIDVLENEQRQLTALFKQHQLKLDALRLVVLT